MKLVCAFIMLFFFSASTMSESRIKTVTMWTYYDFSPFFNEKTKRGLVDDIAQLLTRHSKGHYHFVVEYLPRKRVDLKLKSSQLGMVTLVNPNWFPKTLVASGPLLSGYDVIVSPISKPVKNLIPKETKQRSFIGVTGHQYPMIKSELKSGQVVRIDTSSVPNLLNLIAKKRGDFSIVPGLVAHHYQSHSDFAPALHFEPITAERYTRRMLYNKIHTKLKQDVDDILQQPEVIEQWNVILEQYNLSELATN